MALRGGHTVYGADMLEILLTYNVIMIAVFVILCYHMSEGKFWRLNVYELAFAASSGAFWPVIVLAGIIKFFKSQLYKE